MLTALYASAVIDTVSNELIIKLVNAGDKTENFEFNLSGIKSVKGAMTVTSMHGAELLAYNTMDKPATVTPVTSTIPVKGKKIMQVLPASTFTVVRLKYVQ